MKKISTKYALKEFHKKWKYIHIYNNVYYSYVNVETLAVNFEDFRDLEFALFGGQFSYVLQRMWAFHIFRQESVARVEFIRWFTKWQKEGYDYDLTLFTDWNYEFSFDLSIAG